MEIETGGNNWHIDWVQVARKLMRRQHRTQHLRVLGRWILAAVLVVHVACSPASGPAHQQSAATASSPAAGSRSADERRPDGTALPDSVKPTDVEIQWRSGGGDGCASPHCANYQITLRGDGVVSVEDLGWGGEPPRLPIQTRSIKEDEFITLLNQILEARFIEIPAPSATPRRARRTADSVYFYYDGGGSAPWVDLTLRAGSYRKTLRVPYSDTTPAALRTVVERIWRIGGINDTR
jgi:hypothetical protein